MIFTFSTLLDFQEAFMHMRPNAPPIKLDVVELDPLISFQLATRKGTLGCPSETV